MTGSPLLELVDAALRGATLALLLMIAVALARVRPPAAHRQLGIALALGLCMQVINAMPLVEGGMLLSLRWRAPLIAISVGNALLFWLLVRAMTDDEFVLRGAHGLAWLTLVLLVGVNTAFVIISGTRIAPLMAVVQRAVPIGFSALTVFAASRQWRTDLVEPRRWLRAFIVVTGVAYTLALVFARVLLHGRSNGLAATTDAFFLLAIVAVIATRLLRAGGFEALLPESTPAPIAVSEPLAALVPARTPPPPDPADERLADDLQHAMQAERAYRTEDLTVAVLAARLAVPEYRLRRVINGRLGFRNFNVYVNSFRLAEAREALADPAKRELPILTIALDAGFQSIGPFNRAFKLATGVTPGEFRREKLADS